MLKLSFNSENLSCLRSRSSLINLKIEDTFAVIEGDTRHRYIPAGKGRFKKKNKYKFPLEEGLKLESFH